MAHHAKQKLNAPKVMKAGCCHTWLGSHESVKVQVTISARMIVSSAALR